MQAMDQQDSIFETTWYGYHTKFKIIYELPVYNVMRDMKCVRCEHTFSDCANWGADFDKCYNGETHNFQ